MIKLFRNANTYLLKDALIALFIILMPISVSAITDNELDTSIKNGISWLTDQQNKEDGSWSSDYYPVGTTGLAVVTLLDRPNYLNARSKEASIKGLNFIFSKAYKDGDNMIFFASDIPNNMHTVYETSIAMMAIAASGTPNNIVNVPNSQINGMRFREVETSAFNYLVSQQNNAGGWGYGHLRPGSQDNSNTGFAVLGLAYANDKFGIHIPPKVKTRLNMWINSLQCPSGGAGYNAPCGPNDSYLGILETGNLLYEMALVGDDASTTRAKRAINYIENNWDNPSWLPGWKGPGSNGEKWSNYQATYLAMKGFKGLNIENINVAGNDVNWYNEIASNIVNEQYSNGSWNDTWFAPRILATEFALLTLEKSVSIPTSGIGKEEFRYSGTGNGDTNYGEIYENYNIEVSKDIVTPEPGDPGCQNVIICVKTPKIDFKPVTVFALDSSGSMEQNGYTKPMLEGIGNALASRPGIEYARVDWDALLGTRSIDAVTGISPSPRLSDIDYSGKFRLANTWPNEISTLQGSWRGNPLFSEEPEGTDYYVGLKEALDKIKARKAIATHPFIKQTTAWQIVFVAGKSEFSRGDINSLIKDALANGINISTIGIEIGDLYPTTDEEAQALKDMVTGTKGDNAIDINLNVKPSANEIEQITKKTLKYHVDKLNSTPVIKNVVVTETLYKYLRVLGSSPTYDERKDNQDGTTTLYFRLPNLLQNNTTCIKIYTELNFDKLPVDVSSNKNKPELDFKAAETTPESIVSYETDMALERSGKIPLPEGELSIGCAIPYPPTTPSSVIVANETTPIGEKGPVNNMKPAPGFDVAFAAAGIIAAAYLLRR
jgi:hypothetical protein